MTTPTGSILLRRGPTTDRVAFVPLDGEIIYDSDQKKIFIGDGLTYGGNAVGTAPGSMSDSFTNIVVAGQSNVVADSSTDTLTLVASTGIAITTNATTDTITIANTIVDTNTTYGISAETVTGGAYLRLTGNDSSTDNVKLTSGTGITVSRTSADEITITNASTGTTYSISSETVTGGANLRLTGSDSSTDNVKVTGAGTVTVSRTDSNTITITGSALGDIVLDDITDVSITAPTNNQVLKYNGSYWYNGTDSTTGGGLSSNSFETIVVAGQSSVVADSSTDTLTLVAGAGIAITTNGTSDTITITNTGQASITVAETAAGTTQSTATVLTSIINNVTAVDALTGVKLPTAIAGTRLLVFNNGLNTLAVYPASGAAINGLATDAAFSLGLNTRLEFVAVSTTQWYTMNATYA
jgi:hypothetical protein